MQQQFKFGEERDFWKSTYQAVLLVVIQNLTIAKAHDIASEAADLAVAELKLRTPTGPFGPQG